MGFISDLLIEISSFRIRVGNKLNTLANRIGVLNNLTTTNKNDLVGAINEVRSSVPNVTGFVPYTGANQPIDFNTQSLTTSGELIKRSNSFEQKFLVDTLSSPHYKKLTDVASLSKINDTSVGDIIITLPIKTITRWVAKVDVSMQNLEASLIISGYSITNAYTKVTLLSGFGWITDVRFARDASNNTVLIIKRDTGTSPFAYGKVNISTFYHSVTYNSELAVKANYKINFLDESTLSLSSIKTINQADFEKDNRYALSTSIPTNYITTNTAQTGLTGNKTTSGTWTFNSQINTANHGNSSQWKQAFDWGNFRDYGLGTNAVISNDWDSITATGFYRNVTSSDIGIPIGVTSISVIHNEMTSTNATQMAIRTSSNQMWYRARHNGVWSDWVEIYHTGNFNPAQYVLQTQLANYLPLAGGTMTGDINWNGGGLGLSLLGAKRLVFGSTNVVLAGNTTGTSAIFLRPQGASTATGQVTIDGNGQMNTANHGNSSQWKQAYDWGDFRDYGLGVASQSNQATLNGNIPSSLYTFGATSQTTGAPYDYGGVLTIRRGSNEFVQLALPVQDTTNKPPMYRGRVSTGEWAWRKFITEVNLNTEATALGFIKSSSLSGYLPLSGGTMNSGAVINWSGSQAFMQIGGISKLRFSSTITVLSSSVPQGGSYGIYLRPQGDASTGGQIIIDGNGQINTSNHGNSSQWNHEVWGLGTNAVVSTGLLENINETGFYAFSTSQQGFNYPRAMMMRRGSENYGLIFQNSGDKVGFLTSDGSVYTAWHSGNFNPSDYAAASSVAYYNDGDNVNSNVSWGSNVVGGARNQVQGARNIVKGEDINIFGSRNVSSGINNQINGFANVVTGAFNTLTGAYSSIAGSKANVIGNYLFARDKQTVLGMYNKVYNLGDDEGLRFAFGTGMNDLDKFNAVEIYDDHRTEFHGKAAYDEETRNPAWFTEDYTHVDTYQVGYDHLTHSASSSTPCEHNILEVAVRGNDRFVRVQAFELAFNIHGIVKGNLIEGNIDRTKLHTKGTLQFSDAVRTELLARADISKNPYLVVEYIFDKEEIYVKYVGAFYLKEAKRNDDRIVYIIGNFINKRGSGGQPDITYFEFNQQII